VEINCFYKDSEEIEMIEIDIVIIGAGTAGQTAAYDLVAEGYQVTVVDKSSQPGGVCALHGCQAKKWYYEVTETIARSQHLQGLGLNTLPSVDWSKIRQQKNLFTSGIPADTVANLKGNGINYVEGSVVFTSADTVQVNDSKIKARYFIIAAGARPMSLPINGNEHLTTSNEFLDLKKLPKKIAFIGGGFISFEFAHFAARLGARPGDIHIFEVLDRPLGPFDGEMVAQLCEASKAAGIQIHTNADSEAITAHSNGYAIRLSSGETFDTDLVVHGAGRIPDIDTLNLDQIKVSYNRRGIEVNSHMATSVATIFAVGDCADTVQLARVADREARTAAAAIIAGEEHQPMPPSIDYKAVPAVLFTYPQLAMVGATEEALVRDNIKYWKSYDKELGWPTYKRIGLKHAAYKILVDDDNQILGAHILSDNATGLINIFKQAMLNKISVPDLHRDHIMSPYPSRESDVIYMLDSLLD
jgi:glutathione reductase (NADPH)